MLSRRAILAALALSPVTLHAGEPTAHDFVFPGIEDEPVSLAAFAGGPILVVNTASRCGFTKQYDGLQAIWERYRDRGFTVVGIPSDDFGSQELDTAAEVKDFCEMNFAIDFPMTDITMVRGSGAHPFYRWARDTLGPDKAPSWNFHKYLIGPDGRLIAAFPSAIDPLSETVTSQIERLLSEG